MAVVLRRVLLLALFAVLPGEALAQYLALPVAAGSGVLLAGRLGSLGSGCTNPMDPSSCSGDAGAGQDDLLPLPAGEPLPDAFGDPCTGSAGCARRAEGEAEGRKPARHAPAPEQEHNEFQDFVAASLGIRLPLYGYGLFNEPPDTFAPVQNIPVTSDYLIGSGDELLITGWGKVNFNVRATVSREGKIYLPKVGAVSVAGIPYSQLEPHLKNAVGRVFRNFDLSVSLGKLRSIQIFVVGQARKPGAYTISSLSTLVNAVFASGGPSVKGSLRHIQLKRNGRVAAELDMYDFLIRGDKSRDVPLLPGDVIYVPPIGKLVAVSGSVDVPAIYELKDGRATLSDALDMAGGLTDLAAIEKVRIESIQARQVRQVEVLPLNRAGLDRVLQDGDIVQIDSIPGRFRNAVTLRGNVANPGRYPWKAGMRISDLIPDRDALITRDYWARKNQARRGAAASAPPDASAAEGGEAEAARNEAQLHGELMSHALAEINWDYAVIERLRKDDLTTTLVPFNLGQALAAGAKENPVLEDGDTVTIFSKDDIAVPAEKRTVYVRLEGELAVPGIYAALPKETLRQLVARVGGLSPDAYLYGAELDRESVRRKQQARMADMAERMESEIRRHLISGQRGALSAEEAASAKTQAQAQLALVAKLKTVRATGRIVLEMSPARSKAADLPDIVLEDGDRFFVPGKPSTVSVMGMVYNENEFIYQPSLNVSGYLARAGGPTRYADEARIYLVRADGEVVSAQSSMFRGLSGEVVMPGDTVVVPEQLDRYSLTRDLKDWTQIFFQFALGVASLKVIGVI